MLHFCLDKPVDLLWFGEFISPQRDWKHLTRRLFEYEMMIVTEGELWIADEDREYRVPAGEYLIMSPTRFQHGTRVSQCRFYWMHFRCEALPASLSLPPQATYADGQSVRALSEALLRAEAEEARGVRSRYLATQLLIELARGKAQGEREETPQEKLCNAVKNFVAFHRFSEIKVRDVARELNYHEKYLSTVFHKTEGITLKQYLVNSRLNEAKRLLAETDYTVTQVAYYLNFPSPHNFSRFFSGEAGMTATQFRAMQKKRTK